MSPPMAGYFELEEGSTATGEINFNSTELTYHGIQHPNGAAWRFPA